MYALATGLAENRRVPFPATNLNMPANRQHAIPLLSPCVLNARLQLQLGLDNTAGAMPATVSDHMRVPKASVVAGACNLIFLLLNFLLPGSFSMLNLLSSRLMFAPPHAPICACS